MPVTTYFLVDVDGALCVAHRSPNYSEPRYDVFAFPTVHSTAEFCRYFECKPAELRERFAVAETMPGEYRVTTDHGKPVFGRVYALPLVNGARTASAYATTEPVPVPRAGNGSRLEWESGRWAIYPPKGRRRVVEV